MAITTDPTTPIGQVRLLIADMDASTYIFEDTEIQAFLTLEKGQVRLAAATALVAITSNTGRLASIVELGKAKTQQQAIKDLLAIAKQLRSDNLGTGLQTADMSLSDENYESFWPGWRRVIPPVSATLDVVVE